MTSMGSQNGFTLDEVSNGNGFKIGFEQAIRDRVRERFARERFARETRTAGSSLLWPRIRRVFSRVFSRRCSSAGQRALPLHRAYNVIKFKQNKINFEKQRQHGLVLRSLTTERERYPIEIIELKIVRPRLTIVGSDIEKLISKC